MSKHVSRVSKTLPRVNLLVLILLSSLTAAFSVFGDRVLETNKSLFSRCVIDNLTHAIIGGLSWTVILVLLKKNVLSNLSSIFSCFVLSSIIDLDHFLLAKSFKLSDATRLGKTRPILHNTTLPIIISSILLVAHQKFNFSNSCYNWAWIILTAFLSHHLRDAHRRGLWFFPFGNTAPLPYLSYITLNMILPYVHFFIMHIFPMKLLDIPTRMNIV